jgi:hypothetical protein
MYLKAVKLRRFEAAGLVIKFTSLVVSREFLVSRTGHAAAGEDWAWRPEHRVHAASAFEEVGGVLRIRTGGPL